ncbi:MAG: co-chaperone GroES [Pseudoalteromonas sp.]
MKIRPLNDRILITEIIDEKTAGGIILPTKDLDAPKKGVVMAVGEGTWQPDGSRKPIDAKVGETVLFSKNAGMDVTANGEDFLMMLENDILGVVDSE